MLSDLADQGDDSVERLAPDWMVVVDLLLDKAKLA